MGVKGKKSERALSVQGEDQVRKEERARGGSNHPVRTLSSYTRVCPL